MKHSIEHFLKLDEDAQIEYIIDLECDDDIFKWNLFSNILKESSISDLTRIEVLDVLGASDIPKKNRNEFINILLFYIENRTEDTTFLSHCIMALQNEDLYSKQVYNVMLKIFLDFNDDEDLRMNAYPIVFENSSKKDLINYFENLKKDPNPLFVESSKRWLEDISDNTKINYV